MTKDEHQQKERELRRDFEAMQEHYRSEKERYDAIPADRRNEDPTDKQLHPKMRFYQDRLIPAYQALNTKSIELNKHLHAKIEEQQAGQ